MALQVYIRRKDEGQSQLWLRGSRASKRRGTRGSGLHMGSGSHVRGGWAEIFFSSRFFVFLFLTFLNLKYKIEM